MFGVHLKKKFGNSENVITMPWSFVFEEMAGVGGTAVLELGRLTITNENIWMLF